MSKKKKIASILATAGIGIGTMFGFAGCMGNQNTNNNQNQTNDTHQESTIDSAVIEEMQNKIDEFEQLIKDNQSKIENLESQVEQNKQSIKTITELVSSLTTLYNDLSDKYDELSGELTEFKDLTELELSNLKTTLEKYEETVEKIQSKLQELEIKDNALEQSISNNKNTINGLKVMTSIAYTLNNDIQVDFNYSTNGNAGEFSLVKAKNGDFAVNGTVNNQPYIGTNAIGHYFYKINDVEHFNKDSKNWLEWANDAFTQANHTITTSDNMTYVCKSENGESEFVVTLDDDSKVTSVEYTDNNESFKTTYISKMDSFVCENAIKTVRSCFESIINIENVEDAVNNAFNTQYVQVSQTYSNNANGYDVNGNAIVVASKDKLAMQTNVNTTIDGEAYTNSTIILSGAKDKYNDNSISLSEENGVYTEIESQSSYQPNDIKGLKHSLLISLKDGAENIYKTNENEYRIENSTYNFEIDLKIDENDNLSEIVMNSYTPNGEVRDSLTIYLTKLSKAKFEEEYGKIDSIVYNYFYGAENTL